ncbi:thiol reductant ABC exporter subunit CydC [Paenibacillus sp. TRM 82003]|uniref:thiol reductant ABC exporter subunit CydC n=1 Tax=Kineococcus sp. TRM81007 TaxID=2925831 RepID=UPI001F5A887D|nr:thiol reductant ABC exporter subunit CydC [Kineococcus sp. TRM81007]MCI2240622.1 thiol reductant ABC exporter subunit CydC [Kineococcus sp. TRM81007]MCI3925456.1 thiol reductant ABC exporter subunit CydC [Paenibacillus sp. TRM 82003]
MTIPTSPAPRDLADTTVSAPRDDLATAETTVPAPAGAAQRRPRGPVDPRLLRHARPARRGVAAVAAAETAVAALLVAQAFALADLVVALWRGTDPARALWALAAVVVARAATSWAASALAQRTASAVRADLTRRAAARAVELGPAGVQRFGAARLTALLAQGLPALDGWFTRYLPALVPGVLLPPTVLVLLALLDTGSALTVALTLPLVPVFAVLLGRATQARARRRWRAARTLSAHFLDVVRGLPTLRAHRRAGRQVQAVAATTDAHRRATLGVLRVAFLSSTALELVGTLSVGLVAVTAGMRLAGGTLDLRTALLVILLAPEAYRPLREVGARFHDSADATAVVDDVDELLSSPAVVAGPGGDAAGLRLEGVRVLRADGTAVVAAARGAGSGGGVDVAVAPGELVALAGVSGAGKSTLARVAAGLVVPDAGAVRHPLGAAAVAHLPQRPTFPFARTVAEAVRAGRAAPDEEVAAALAMAAAAEMDPARVLGEGASGLSAGQRQRLALARTFLGVLLGARRLVLDEPTAHLDAASERAVVATLRGLAARGCAVLVVAHRPALLAAADRGVPLTRPSTPPSPAETSASAPPSAPVEAGTTVPAPGGRWTASVRARGALAVVAGAAAVLAGAALTATATWLIVTAADRPPVLTLSVAAVVVRASATARPLLVLAERLLSHDAALARLAQRRAAVVAALVPRVPGPLTRRRAGGSGDLLVQLVHDVDARVDALLRWRHPVAATALALALALAAAALADPVLALAALPGLVVAAVLAPLVAGVAERRADAHRDDVAALAQAGAETAEGVEDLRSTGAPQPLEPLHRSVSRLAAGERRRARAAAGTAALQALGAGLAVLGPAALAPSSGAGAAWAAAVVLAAAVAAEATRGLPDAVRARHRAVQAERRGAELLAVPATATEPAGPRPLPAGRALRLRGVVAGWEEPALRGVDLDLAPGEVVAVRGASGTGKSTLAAVLMRFLDPRAGEVTLDGVPLADLAGDDVRSVVGLVADDEHVFATSLRENLLLARPGRDDADLLDVLHRVRLGDWLAALPAGLDSRLGDGGAPLSGGERRRLAMARALLADVAVLVLDEPSEGLDEATGRALVADLVRARGERSVLLLAHRDEGVDLADRVLELRGGRLEAVASPTAA